MMPALDLADEPIPLWWTTDFILSSEPGAVFFFQTMRGIRKCHRSFLKIKGEMMILDEVEDDKFIEFSSLIIDRIIKQVHKKVCV